MEVQKKRERRQDLFLTQYQEYRTKFISHAVFDDLDESDKQTFSDFGKTAHKVFHEIIKARKLGEEYRVAALSFFASGDVLDHAGWSYLILRTSYFVEALYIKLAVIPDSQAKQKETFDLFRYIAKSILQQSEESSLKDESKRLLEYFIEYMLELEQDKVTSDWESFLKNKIKQNLHKFTQTKVLNYINDLKIIFKRLKQGRIVKRSRRKRIKISDWPTKKKLRSFQKKREQRQLLPDIVVSCTASSLPIVGLGAVERALKKRRHRPMFMVDLAVPRDIEPEVKQLEDVYLYTVDDLASVVQTAQASRQAAVEQAEAIIDAGVQSFLHWMDQRDPEHGVVPLILQLQGQTDTWRATELARARKRLARGEDIDAVLEALSRGVAKKMLHGTLAELRNADPAARSQTAHTAARLFLRSQSKKAL